MQFIGRNGLSCHLPHWSFKGNLSKCCGFFCANFIYPSRATSVFLPGKCLEELTNQPTPWPGSVSELYRPSGYRLSSKLVPTFVDRGWCVVSVTDPYGRILGFLDRSLYFFFQVAPQLYSRGWVDSVPDPLLLRKSGSAGNQTWTSGSVARNSDH
jgi:hypothetical protein